MIFTYLVEHPEQVFSLLLEHVKLVGIASGLAIMAGVSLGILISRPSLRKFAQFVLSIVNIGQTVPSLAVVALAMGFLGTGFKPAIFALFIYSLLPIVRNTYTGIMDIDPAIIEAARGMGMKNSQILFKIQLPLAFHVIMAGVRTSVVVNVGTATLAFLIGGGGLGDLIFTGISMVDTGLIFAGALPAALLAIVLDTLLGKTENMLIPKGLKV